MDTILLFALLGCGAGAAYALTGLGVVLVYKGSGVINLAQGAFAMMAALCYNQIVSAGVGVGAAAVLTIVGAAAFGVAVYALIMRPLRRASALSQVVATIGLVVVLDAFAELVFASATQSGSLPPQIVPSSSVRLLGAYVQVDRFWLLGVAVVLSAVLYGLFRYTRFGLATRAAAQSERAASLLGISPDLVAAGNWGLGGAVAALAGILIAPISSLDVTSLTFIILPAMAAALVGRFSSFGITALAGVLIGVAQSLITRYWNVAGMAVAFPLLVAVLAIVITGSRLPMRGQLELRRPPLATDGRIKLLWAVILPVVTLVGLSLAGLQGRSAIITSMTGTMLALSVVVVTGLVGQINLAPLSFAAVGAFTTSLLGQSLGLPFPLPLLAAAVVAVPVGVLIGLPSLRVRGMTLAVVTLGVGIAMEAVVFENYTLAGGAAGRPVPSPSLFGLSFDSTAHPVRFGEFALVILCALAVVVCNVRRSSIGRKMLAVRSNERAAAAVGISVAGVKIFAFALSASIAATAGSVIAYQAGATSSVDFTTELSLAVVGVAFIGGIAAVSGAFQAGLIVNGGVLYLLLNQIGGIARYWNLAAGVLLILTVVTQPDGVALKNIEIKRLLRAKWTQARGRPGRALSATERRV